MFNSEFCGDQMHIIMMPNMTSTKLSRSKRYCRTWLGSHFRALPVYIKRGCAALKCRDFGRN